MTLTTDPTLPPHMDFPVGKSWLETMPNELLEMIAKILAPEYDLRDYTDLMLPVAYNKVHVVSELLGLCSASRRLESVVRPAMFRDVVICRSTELTLILRTLTENPGLGRHIKRLELATAFLRQDPDHEFLDLDMLRGIDPDLDLILPKQPARMTSRQENELRSNLYLKVLDRAPAVRQVTVYAPSWGVRGLDNRQLSAFGIASIMAHKRTAMPHSLLPRLPETLSTLAIEGPIEREGLTEHLPSQLSGLWRQDLADESSLEKMTWISDDTTWFDSLPGQQWASDGTGLKRQLASLTTLHLFYTTCRFSDIAIVCDSFPSLRDLKIISDWEHHCLEDPRTDDTDGLSPSVTRLCLTRSITKLRHLETLTLYLASVPKNRKLLGANSGLDLSSLYSLKEVSISFRLIVFNRVMTSTGARYQPFLVLPQSMEKLEISTQGLRCEAGMNLMRFLGELREACRYGFPRLRCVLYGFAAGRPRVQIIESRRICRCACVPHKDYCTYDTTSGLTCTYMPRILLQDFRDLGGEFRKRGIMLMGRPTLGYIVFGR